MMIGYSTKAWLLAIGAPIVAFLAASVVGAVIAASLVVCCARCRKRYLDGARGRDLIALHYHGVPHDR